MQQREMTGWWARYALFLLLSFGILGVHFALSSKLRGPPANQQVARQGLNQDLPPGDEDEQAAADREPDEPEPEPSERPSEPEAAAGPPDASQPEAPAATEAALKPETPPEAEGPAQPADVDLAPCVAPEPALVTLGSLDPASPFRELVTLTNLGAAVVRVELNSPRFNDLEDRTGYLGHLALDEILNQNDQLAPDERERRVDLRGCRVDVVGPGTPAARAGLKPGDLIASVDGREVSGLRTLGRALGNSKPHQTVELTVLRDGKPVGLSATLERRPLEVVGPENGDPLSFLLTLRQIDEELLDDVIEADDEADEADEVDDQSEQDDEEKKGRRGVKERDETINLELPGLDLRTGAWQIEDRAKLAGPGPHTSVTFFRELPEHGLRIRKTYRLAQVPENDHDDPDARAYHLELEVEIENVGQAARKVAYQLDGPTGLPVEGKWYAYKVGHGGGLRDVVVSWERRDPAVIGCRQIAVDDIEVWGEQSMTYVGVDAQYFSAIMIPQKKDPDNVWFSQSQPLRVGAVDEDWKKAANTSCRVVSKVHDLQPGQASSGPSSFEHTYTIFAGPKKPPLLAKYGLKDVVYYGWFGWVAVPMITVLHFFYAIVGNYGIAIILLTVLVRGCMFPLSIKQQRGAQKMQELQPKIKELHEKYKNNAEAKVRAQQELFRKHKYNPLSGCLILFLQFPIFIGLYRGLAVDVELRQAPLLPWESIRWCSNLAAPDMLFDWTWFWNSIGWTSLPQGLGLLPLGPYLNVLPLLTVGLFLMQQKMFMPPPADEQQAMQQNVMKYMMLFMGIIFFKVASGLCLYFIASSLWGLAERKLLPKALPAGAGGRAKAPKPPPAQPKPRAPEQAKPAPPKPPRPKPAQPKPRQPKPALSNPPRPGSNHDGTAGRKKKRKKKKKRSRGKQ